MPRRYARLLLPALLLALLLVPRPATAQSGNIVLRLCVVQEPGLALCYGPTPMQIPVETNDLSTPTGPFYHAYLMGIGFGEDPLPPFVGGNGIRTIAGVECGIDYLGGYVPEGGASPICVFNWTSLGDFQLPSTDWPAPGSGILITWTQNNCQAGRYGDGVTIAMAGYFYMAAYAPAQLRVIPRPVSGLAQLARCDGSVVNLTPPLENCGLGMLGFQMPGFDGVCSVPVVPTTWGRLKAQY